MKLTKTYINMISFIKKKGRSTVNAEFTGMFVTCKLPSESNAWIIELYKNISDEWSSTKQVKQKDNFIAYFTAKLSQIIWSSFSI